MKKELSLSILALATAASATTTSLTPSSDFVTAFTNAKAGDTLKLEAGTYSVKYTSGSKNTINLTKTGTASAPIVIMAEGFATAIIDFNFPEGTYVQDSYGLYVTGSYYEFHGLAITRAGYQGAYVTGSYNSFTNCAFYENRNSGLEINKGGNHTTVTRVDAYRNFDPKKNGSMADGFASKQKQGAGNKFYECRAWENSDDGFDAYDSPDSIIVIDSWAFRNGVNVFGVSTFEGNGNGFKLGGNSALANNRCTRCIAFGNPGKGFDQNNNTGGITVEQSIGYANGINFGMGGTLASGQKHTLYNNISYAGKSSDSYGSHNGSNNSWDLSVTVNASDFQGVDTTQATLPRNADGSLQTIKFLHLASGSGLIDAGKNIGYTYNGDAPDLGPFETGESTTAILAAQKASARAALKLRHYNLLGREVKAK